jgi:hypothetical protein
MSSASATSAKAQQLQQLLAQLSAAPDLSMFSSKYCSRVKQLRVHVQRPDISTELLLLVARTLSNGLQHLEPLLQTQTELPDEAVKCIGELLVLLVRCEEDLLDYSNEQQWCREMTQTGKRSTQRHCSGIRFLTPRTP